MNDFEQFVQLVEGGYSCISIVTFEEHYALEIVRKTAEKLKRDMWVWSVAEGVRDGMLDGGPVIAKTDTPAAGLANMAQAKPGSICVALDLAEHLTGGKALRILRDMIDDFGKTGICIVLIDCTDKLPDVIKAGGRRFEISLPDEKELHQIVHRGRHYITWIRYDRPQPARADAPAGRSHHQRHRSRRSTLRRRGHQCHHRQQTPHDSAKRAARIHSDAARPQ
jgi:hypothetical protein